MSNDKGKVEIVQVDYQNPQQANHLCKLLNVYATDIQGGGKSIDPKILDSLPEKLHNFPTAQSFLLYVGGQPAAMANCFLGFSTFSGKPLMNIHDFAVSPEFRKQGLSQRLLEYIEQHAKTKENCCKITLEVLSENHVAKNAYQKFGFEGYELDPESGQAVFWQKKL